MPFTLTMPKLSPTMEEGVIARWHKSEGEFVAVDDLILEVSTDKATVEYNSLEEGWLKKIIAAEGHSIAVNQPIAVFTQEEKESIEGYVPEGVVSSSPKEEKEEKQEIPVASPQEIETPTPAPSYPIFTPEPPLEDLCFSSASDRSSRLRASPLARKQAEERGIDLSQIKGTGPGGRVVVADLEGVQPNSLLSYQARATPQKNPGSYQEESLSPMRKAIATHLQQAKMSVPHFYVEQVIDASPLVFFRDQLKAVGARLTYNDCIIKACALALREHPAINRGFHGANQTIIQFETIDIAIAVTVDEGLFTPIIRHADYKNLAEISTEAKSLAKRAREGKLKREEYRGGSFTVSNLGMIGITKFQAVLNPPQAAILAIGGIQEAPVVKEGKVVPGKQMHLTLSADHRVIDGVAAATFLVSMQKLLENPAILLC